MKKFLFFVLLFCLAASAQAQLFYLENFNSGSFPAGWAPTDSRILLSNESPSTGYAPPPASGSFNVRFDDCEPQSQTVRLVFSPGISTVGKTNLRVGFGRRVSSAWNNQVVFQWRATGPGWNTVDDVAAGATTTWDYVFYDLPSGADNKPNLQFRFSFTTSLTANCTTPPNFRIDDFAVGENFSLPVELTHFEARPDSRQVQLSWATASETGNAFFAVERSADGYAYTEIGQVAGGGTTRETRQYTFWDERPFKGGNHYRLRQVDQDGAFSYGPVRVADFLPNTPRVFPSPVRDVLQVEWVEPSNGDLFTWEVFDLTGRLLSTGQGRTEADERWSIPVHAIPSGFCRLQITTNRQTWTNTFMKY